MIVQSHTCVINIIIVKGTLSQGHTNINKYYCVHDLQLIMVKEDTLIQLIRAAISIKA
jgi:hypothetical protein